VGGMRPVRMAWTQMAASSAPAPPNRCPVIDFDELIARRSACSPSAWRMARVFCRVAGAGRCAVSVDVRDLLRGNTGSLQGDGDAAPGAGAFLVWGSQMHCVGGGGVGQHFSQRLGAALQGKVQLFQQQQSPPSDITNPSRSMSNGREGAGGFVITVGERPHLVEGSDANRCYGGPRNRRRTWRGRARLD